MVIKDWALFVLQVRTRRSHKPAQAVTEASAFHGATLLRKSVKTIAHPLALPPEMAAPKLV